jgi:hypothetical protein
MSVFVVDGFARRAFSAIDLVLEIAMDPVVACTIGIIRNRWRIASFGPQSRRLAETVTDARAIKLSMAFLGR